MADQDEELLKEARAREAARREERIRKVMEEGGFSQKQAEWFVDRDLDIYRLSFRHHDTPIGPGSGYEP